MAIQRGLRGENVKGFTTEDTEEHRGFTEESFAAWPGSERSQRRAAVPTTFLTARTHALLAAASPHRSAAQTTATRSAASRDSRRTELRFRECPPDSQLRCRYRRDTWPADHSPSRPTGTQASDRSAQRSHPLS